MALPFAANLPKLSWVNIAAIISLCAAALQLGMGLLLVGLAHAPGWRVARTFALIALTAAAYSAADVFFALPSASDTAVLWASRTNYCVGALHATAWLLYTFGGPSASPRQMPLLAKIVAGLLTAAAFFVLVTGAHAVPGQWVDLRIDWANVQYHTPVVHEWAEWYALAMLAALAVPFVRFIPRSYRREPGALLHLIGFILFFSFMSVEVLVTNGVINTFYLGDIGFLAAVIPVAAATVRRVVSDAGTLDLLSRKLAGEVKERTVALDRATNALAESERHAALGRLAAGVGHEINNPLTYLILSLEEVELWARSTALPSEVREALTNARDGTERIRLVVDGLRTYTRTTAGELRLASLDAVARSALRVASHHVQHVAQLHVDLQPTAQVLADESQLVQVAVNLITNSAQAIAESGIERAVSITVRTFTRDDGRVVLEVADTGPGIAEDNLGRLSEPYFTTRAHNGGTGLGLFLSRGIVERHSGEFELESKAGAGTVARVILPAADAMMLAAGAFEAEAHAPEQAAITRRRVLLIDDEPLLTRAMARTLAAHCDVLVAESATRALEILDVPDATPCAFDVVLCDIMMPGMTGIEFADVLHARHPKLRRRTLFLTGGAVTSTAGEFLLREDVHYLTKPVTTDHLVKAIEQAALVA